MKVAYATCIVLWLIASLYWTNSLIANSHTPHAWNLDCCFIHTNKINKNTSFLATSSLQAPLVHKWNGNLSSTTTKTPTNTKNNNQIFFPCRMAYSRNLDNSFNGVQDMETSQTKKRNSSNACLTILEKTKSKSNTPKRNAHLWLGFKAMNALNASKGIEEVAHKSVSELMRMGMSDKEALECHDCITSYPYVVQEMWPNTNEFGVQNFHHTQIPSDVYVFEGFAMDYHVALFLQLEEMIIPKDEALNQITKRLEKMNILLGDEISDPIAIMCTHEGKQWVGHVKVHLKNVQEDGVKLLQGLHPFII